MDEIQEYGIHEERSLMVSLWRIFNNIHSYIYKIIKYLQCMFLINCLNKGTHIFATMKNTMFKFITIFNRRAAMLLLPIIYTVISSVYNLLMPLIKKLLCKVLGMLENMIYLN